jgi:hypothetical protein
MLHQGLKIFSAPGSQTNIQVSRERWIGMINLFLLL